MTHHPGGAQGRARPVAQALARLSLGLGILSTLGVVTSVAYRARLISTAIVVASLAMGLIGVFSRRRGVAAFGIVLSLLALLQLVAPIGR
jgi:hypothetical protein